MVSLFDLPNDDSGVQPAGMWMLVLRDKVNDSFGGLTFVDGVTAEPVSGRCAARACASLSVLGAMRVDGGAFEAGDVSALKSAAQPDDAEPEEAPAVEPEEAPKKGRGK